MVEVGAEVVIEVVVEAKMWQQPLALLGRQQKL